MQAMRTKYGADPFVGFEEWSGNIDTEYSISTIVEYAETLWEATELINQFTIYPDGCDGPCAPSLVYDIDGDNINDIHGKTGTILLFLLKNGIKMEIAG